MCPIRVKYGIKMSKHMKEIYMDSANVSRPAPEVVVAMMPYLKEKFGVPGGAFGHRYEEEASEALWRVREAIAASINASPEEIIFTSGVTEGNNLAIKGFMRYGKEKKRALTTPIERKCVLESLRYMEKEGHDVSMLPVEDEGFVDEKELENLSRGVDLISVQHVNQEIGTVQDIRRIGETAEDRQIVFHTDATHGFLKEKIDVEKMNIDMLTISGHVIHGPPGSGALFIREGLKIEPLLHGDGKEFGKRAGHPNMPAIIGMAEAIRLMKDADIERMKKLSKMLLESLSTIDDSRINGPMKNKRVCDIVNLSFKGVEGEAILMAASSEGLVLRTGSACFSPNLRYSHVMRAIGRSAEDANSSTRLSISRYTTENDVVCVYEILKEIIERLRDISPVYRKVKK